jgi:uncharacterized protein YkwD
MTAIALGGAAFTPAGAAGARGFGSRAPHALPGGVEYVRKGVRTRPHHARCARRSAQRHGRRHAATRAACQPAPTKAGHRHIAPHPAPTAAHAASPTGPSTASIIAAVLATPCQNTELTPEPANLPLVREAVLCLINTERAQHGELPLSTDPRLEASAESHVQDMIAEDYFDHVSPSGVSPVDRDRSSGYLPNSSVGYVIGENLAWGTYELSTPQSIVAAWIASPGHLANILESSYHDTGIAIVPQVPTAYANGSPGSTYAQEFGVITE